MSVSSSKSAEEKEQENAGFVSQYELNFLYGIVIWICKPSLTIPLPLVTFLGFFMLFTSAIHTYMYAGTLNWFSKLVDSGFIGLNLSSMYIAIKYKNEIIQLSKDLNSWVEYMYLNEERKELIQNSKKWAEWFNYFYISAMYFGSATYSFLPLGRFLSQESTESMNLLIYPSWSPLPIDTKWGFCVTFLYQSILLLCANLSFGRTVSYFTICLLTIGRQMRLIGIALLTIEDRVKKMIRKNANTRNWDDVYNFTLEQEIKKCAVHFQTLRRAAMNAKTVFKPMAFLIYQYGMLVLCATGVKLATDQQLFMMVQTFMLIIMVLSNIYIFSVICENFISEAESLRITTYFCPWYNMPVHCQKHVHMLIVSMLKMPSITTYFGTQVNIENFSKILNGSYYYITTILAMQTD